MSQTVSTNRNVLKFLTPKQKRVLDVFVEALGAQHTNARRSVMKGIAKERLGTGAAPAWITRNPNLRSKESRGNYDLTALTKLQVREIVVEEKKTKVAPATQEASTTPTTKKTPPVKKAAVKKKAPTTKKAPKAPSTKKAAVTTKKKKTAKTEEPVVETPLEVPVEDVEQPVELLPDEEELG